MKTITVAELRQNPTAALADVERGETYTVTRHRRPIARLVPASPDPLGLIPAKNPGGSRLSERHARMSYEEAEVARRELRSEW